MARNYTLGRKKVPLDQATDKDLNYWGKRTEEEIAKDPTGQYVDFKKGQLRAIKAEIQKRRSNPSAPAAAAPVIQAPPVDISLVEAIADPNAVNRKLMELASQFHLVTPATAVGNLPEGCEVQFSLIKIAPDDPHLYSAGNNGEVSLDKYHLLSILGAAGGNIDDLKRVGYVDHPHYCECGAWISYRQFDGTWARRSGSAVIDVREPLGPNYVSIMRDAQANDRDPAPRLAELRKFILPQTESRALNRAIANIGVRRSYPVEALAKPFMVVKLAFTGRSEDPEARAQFRKAIADSFLDSSRALYGAPSPIRRRPAPEPPPPPHDEEEPFHWDVEDEPATKTG